MRTWTVAVAAAMLTFVTTQAQAQEWCGFRDQAHARFRCGFTSYRECHDVVGKKNVYCIPNPEFASRMTPRTAQKRVAVAALHD